MPPPFHLNAAHPVLDFVNTLDNRFIAAGPDELVGSYSDLLRFGEQAGLLDKQLARALTIFNRSAAATRSLVRARTLREALATLLYTRCSGARAPAAAILKTLQCHFRAAGLHRELIWSRDLRVEDAAPRLIWDRGRFRKNPDLPIWILAQSAEQLLGSEALNRIHMCRSATCRWLFLDTSKNHSRQWCDMKVCGNRMKARKFQARLAG
jgi:predicted RNA-binding Zn ribbon-like protein